jgi:hypothetical protein
VGDPEPRAWERNSGLPLPSRMRKPLYVTLPDIDRMPGKGRELPILGIFRLPQLPVSDVPFFPTEAMPRKRAAPPSDVVQHLQQYRCGCQSSQLIMASNISSSVVAADRSSARISRIACRAALRRAIDAAE